MRKFWKPVCLVFFAILTSGAYSEVSTSVSLRDSNLPLVPVDVNTTLKYVDYGQIMVGTQLSITIDSNEAVYWSGKLLIEEEQRNYGVLYDRPDSCLEAAGLSALIYDIFPEYWEQEDKYVQGFNMSTDFPPDVNIGDWFILDYNAVDFNTVNTYDCNVALYWVDDSNWPSDYGLIHHLRFDHVPTRDFNADTQVDFQDFSVLSWYWLDANCVDVNDCSEADLDFSGVVDANDLYLFVDFWLEKTK